MAKPKNSKPLGTIKKQMPKKMLSEARKMNARGPREDTHIAAQRSRNTDRFNKARGVTRSSGKSGGQYSSIPDARPEGFGFTGKRITGGGRSKDRQLERSGKGPFGGLGGSGTTGSNRRTGYGSRIDYKPSGTRMKSDRTTYGPVDVAEPGNYGPTRASKRRQSQSFR
jgi:hypothetical protein